MPEESDDKYIVIEDIQYEAQELSGLKDVIDEGSYHEGDEEVKVIDSFPSIPALRVNVPEVQEAKATFKYNYFLPNEREIINNVGEVIDVSVSTSNEIFFELSNDKIPRFVEFSFKPPKKFGRIKELRNTQIVSNNLDKILVEGGSVSSEFTSFELVDTGAEKHLYEMMNSSLIITETGAEEDSPQDGYNKLLEALSDGELTGQEKKLVSSALKGIQSKGYNVASSDVGDAAAETADDLAGRQNFSMQINNLLFDQVISSGIRVPDSLFQDEFGFIKTKSPRISGRAKRRNASNSMNESLYVTKVNPISIKPIQQSGKGKKFAKKKSTVSKGKSYPNIKHAGYIIKKLEVFDDDRYEERGFLISDNPDGLFIIDKNVRYGGVYSYEIRSIYQVEMIAETRNENDASLDTVSVVTVLIASEGTSTSVRCVENIPPPPPTNLKISFEYKSRKPFVTWQFPVNPQRDIKRFQIFKRHSTSEPFTLIKEYDFDNSTIRTSVSEVAQEENLVRFSSPRISFTDNTWESGQKPIYAVACVDAHGLSSNLSSQIQFEYIARLNKIKNTLISFPNAPKPYPNILLNKDSFEDAIKVSGYERMRVYFDPEYYKVTKNIPGRGEIEQDQNFISIDKDNDTYKIHILNLDLQKDKILNIRVGDFSGSPLDGVSKSTFSFTSIDL